MIAPALTALILAVFGPSLTKGQPAGIENGGSVEAPSFPTSPTPASSPLLQEEKDRCGEIIDAHLHEAIWYSADKPQPLYLEMSLSGISRGVLMSPYGALPSPFSDDPNTSVQKIASESEGKIFGLVSCNTTGDWNKTREAELERLTTDLTKDDIVGAKVANPHTCLPFNSDIMRDIVDTVSKSPNPLMYIHVGTTPMCGPFGLITIGMIGCCSEEYVDPMNLDDLIGDYPGVTFVLLHAGHDFLEPNEENYFNNTLVDNTIAIAKKYPNNTWLEISALLKQPLADMTMKKIVSAGMASRAIYGSDVNHFPGGLLSYLEMAVSGMDGAGFTEEERCATLNGNAIKVFGLPPGDGGEATMTPTLLPTSGPPDTSSSTVVIASLRRILSLSLAVSAGMLCM